jgi:DNA-binding protein HU-beta
MKKPEIISFVSDRAKISKKAAEAVLDIFVSSIHIQLREAGKVRIRDLGTFRVINMDARKGVNPRTGKEMTIPAMCGFHASQLLRL